MMPRFKFRPDDEIDAESREQIETLGFRLRRIQLAKRQLRNRDHHQPLLLSSAKRRLRSSSAFAVAGSFTGTAAVPA